jgi:MFS superfamily sulfate permease-like transporter
LISIGLSLLLVVRHTTKPRVTILGKLRYAALKGFNLLIADIVLFSGSHNKFVPVQDCPGLAEHIEGVLIVKIQEPLIFANTGQLKDRLRRSELFGDVSVHPSEVANHQPISCIIFDIENMPECDARLEKDLYAVLALNFQSTVLFKYCTK